LKAHVLRRAREQGGDQRFADAPFAADDADDLFNLTELSARDAQVSFRAVGRAIRAFAGTTFGF
jgi:hypothetical protein